MAKAKEKMEALVPMEEQPYTVPANWRWVRLGGITEVIGGGTPSSGNKEYYTDGDIPWISPADLSGYNDIYISYGAKFITSLGLQNSSARLLPKDTVCLSTRAPIGYVAIANNEISTNQGFKSFLPSEYYFPRYLYWYLKGNKSLLESMASGTTFLELSGSKAAMIPCPLAPLSEQERIADRIESLFAKLDEAKEKAQAVVDGYEDRKAAILHKAFTGELTEKWREENDGCFRKTVTIKSICSSLAYGTTSKSSKEGKVAVLRMGNLQDGEIDWGNLVYSNIEADNQKYRLCEGDVLFNRTNSAEQVGKTAIYRGEVPAIYAGYLIKLDYDHSKIIGEYLNYLLNSPEAKEYCNRVKTDAVNQSNINAQKIGAFEIPLISIDEQKKLVGKVAFLIDSEKMTRDSAEKTIKAIETMKKSILAKAFRGELGTNDPSEEPVAL